MTMNITIFSQNLRNKYNYFVHEFATLLNQSEFAIIFIQDMGNVGPDGPQDLRQALAPHNLITNTVITNKSRNTGIILHKNWEIIKTQKHESGGLTGVEVKNGDTTLFVICAYLPTALDAYGMPESFDSTKESEATTKQENAHAIYSTAIEWIQSHKNWVLGGDLNETSESWDRKKLSEKTYSYHGTGTKFINNFLNEAGGIDLWRTLHPFHEKLPEAGHTCFHNKGRSSARLDYFLMSRELFQSSEKTQMLLGEWYQKAPIMPGSHVS
jgi:exonuclease III